MDEKMIYQNMSQLVFNAMTRGVPREEAIKNAEETLRELMKKTKTLAKELAAPESVNKGK